jgi:hypothetical protein
MADITSVLATAPSALTTDTTFTGEETDSQVEQFSDEDAFTEQASSAIAKASLRILHDALIRGRNVDDETALSAKGPFDVPIKPSRGPRTEGVKKRRTPWRL